MQATAAQTTCTMALGAAMLLLGHQLKLKREMDI
jgi:hypothetical protein